MKVLTTVHKLKKYKGISFVTSTEIYYEKKI